MDVLLEVFSLRSTIKQFWFGIGFIILGATFYGLFTWDTQNGVEFYIENGTDHVTAPLTTSSFEVGKSIKDSVLTPFVESIFSQSQ